MRCHQPVPRAHGICDVLRDVMGLEEIHHRRLYSRHVLHGLVDDIVYRHGKIRATGHGLGSVPFGILSPLWSHQRGPESQNHAYDTGRSGFVDALDLLLKKGPC